MNYYEHHLGDYAAATVHLTWDEDIAYTRLIRAYYHHEKPIPLDLKEACRLVRAVTVHQRKAVERVLTEFFQNGKDGWHQKRCDEEIELYRARTAASESRHVNERERQRRSREGRRVLFDQLRNHGITPKWDTPTHELEAHLSRVTGHDSHAPVTRTSQGQSQTCHAPVTASQSPPPIPHTPDTNPKTPKPPYRGCDSADVQKVFEHWQTEWDHGGAKLDDKRRTRIEARLRKFTADQLCQAISGFRNSTWHMGTDPKGNGVVFDKVETLLRDDGQVEQGLRFFTHPPRAPPKPEELSPVDRVLRANGVNRDGRVVSEQVGSSDPCVGNADGDVWGPAHAGVRRDRP